MDIVLTGRKVTAQECERIGLCEYVVDDGGARDKAEQLARDIARFPQSCVRADRRSVVAQHGLGVRDALVREWHKGAPGTGCRWLAGGWSFQRWQRPSWRLGKIR